MDDVIEIDPRKIIENLLTNWKWIALLTLLVGLAAFAFSILQPRRYSAKATIAVSRPRYMLNLDSQYQTVNNPPPTNKAIVSLAYGDEIIEMIYQLWESPKKETTSWQEFRESYLEAKADADPSIVTLTVLAETPQQAAQLVNVWAQKTVQSANRVFSGTDGLQVQLINAQLETARRNLQQAQNDLSNFESRNQISILNNRLSSLLTLQADWLRKQRLIEDAARDADGLVAQLDALAQDAPVEGAAQINFMVLQMKVYADVNSSVAASTTSSSSSSATSHNPGATVLNLPSAPLQFQLPAPSTLPPLAKADFVKQVRSWTEDMKSKAAQIQQQLDAMAAEVYDLQQQIREQMNEQERLLANYQSMQEVYTTVLTKSEEAKLTSDDLFGNVQIGSLAGEPVKPDSRNTIRNTAIGLIMGFALGACFILTRGWWKNEL
jgi:uncharacterized protein involved in exopolysaccharide biosynthesis